MASELLRNGCKCGLVFIVHTTNCHPITRSSLRLKRHALIFVYNYYETHLPAHTTVNMAKDSLTYTKSDIPTSTHGTNTLHNSKHNSTHFLYVSHK
jgi:hypothetical protein